MSELARTPKQIGNAIRNARRAKGLSQSALAEKAGVRQETISQIENGNQSARLNTILAVLAALDLEVRVTPRSHGAGADIEDIF